MKCLKIILKKVRKLADKKGMCSSLMNVLQLSKKNYDGLRQIFKVNPDIALFGKALGNGYAITAIVGKKILCEVLRIILLVAHLE